jgi:heme-degrading monooxygenase HmoA
LSDGRQALLRLLGCHHRLHPRQRAFTLGRGELASALRRTWKSCCKLEAKRTVIIQIVKLQTDLSEDELLTIAHERAPQFRAIPGLVQKYYVRGQNDGEFAGVYLWDSLEALTAFLESDLAKSIPAAYQVAEPPVVEVGEVLFPLRD